MAQGDILQKNQGQPGEAHAAQFHEQPQHRQEQREGRGQGFYNIYRAQQRQQIQRTS